MKLDRAKEFLQELTVGVGLYTREHFPAGCSYQHADTVPALYAIQETAKPQERTLSVAELVCPHDYLF